MLFMQTSTGTQGQSGLPIMACVRAHSADTPLRNFLAVGLLSPVVVCHVKHPSFRALLHCNCKLSAICWDLEISCTLRNFTNLP